MTRPFKTAWLSSKYTIKAIGDMFNLSYQMVRYYAEKLRLGPKVRKNAKTYHTGPRLKVDPDIIAQEYVYGKSIHKIMADWDLASRTVYKYLMITGTPMRPRGCYLKSSGLIQVN